jgi:hypothetical protein
LDRIKLTDDVSIATYSFSEDITCMEVYVEGNLHTILCSDKLDIEEWKADKDTLMHVLADHVKPAES